MSNSNEILSTKVASSVTKRIIDEEYSVGDLLPTERDMQEDFKVSRTVIREAIKLLTARGLVTTTSRQGTLVNPDLTGPLTETMRIAFLRSQVYIEDILEVRLVIEPQIARLAAENATSKQVRQLLALSDRFSSIPISETIGDAEEMRSRWLTSDREIHSLLAEATQNPIYPILVDVLVGQIWHSVDLIKLSVSEEHHNIVVQQHANIANLVAAKNAQAAEEAMRQHLDYTRQYLPILRKRLQDIG